MNINDENIDVRHSKNDVRQSDEPIDNTHQSSVRQNDVRQKDDVRQIAKLDIRMPQKLKDEIHRQAEELGMSASSLAKVVLAQAFIK